MNMTTARKRLALAITAVSAPLIVFAASPASASQLIATDILTQFNAVVAGNFSTNSDVEGRLVAKNITAGATFYNKPNALAGASAFQAVNALTIQGCQSCNIDNGGSVNYVTSNAGSFNFNGGGSLKHNSPGFAISDFTAPLDALVSQLSGLTANSTFTAPNSNSLVFNVAPVNGVAVFDITGAQLSAGNYNISFNNAIAASSIIINVTGDFTEGSAENFNGNTFLNEHVIWNFVNAANVSVKSWSGAVLAKDATVTNSSQMNGFLYAQNFNGRGELHSYPFEGDLPGVPEPSTWAIWLAAAARRPRLRPERLFTFPIMLIRRILHVAAV